MRKPKKMGEIDAKETVVEETVGTEMRMARLDLEDAKNQEKSKRKATQQKYSWWQRNKDSKDETNQK